MSEGHLMSRRFLTISLLISIPLGAMNLPEGAAVKYMMASRAYRQYIEKNINKIGVLGMQPITVAVDLAKDPGTASTAMSTAATLGTMGGLAAGFLVSAPVGAAIGGALFLYYWNNDSSSSSHSKTGTFIAPDNTTISNDFVTDPITQFNVYSNDPRYAEIKATQPALVAFVAPTPPINNNGGPKKKRGDHPHPEWKHHPDEFKKDSRTVNNYKERKDGSLVLKDGAKDPYRTEDGKAIEILKIDKQGDEQHVDAYVNRTHVGSLDIVSREIEKGSAKGRPYCSKGNVKSAETEASEELYAAYHDRTTHNVTQWQVSQTFPIEQPSELYGQAAADAHYSSGTTSKWSGSWKIGE